MGYGDFVTTTSVKSVITQLKDKSMKMIQLRVFLKM